MDREEIRIFTAGSVAAGVALGAGLALALHLLAGASVTLAVATGLTAAAFAAILPLTWRDGRFGWFNRPSAATRRHPGFLVWAAAYLLIMFPSFIVVGVFLDDVIESGDELALRLLFLFTGLAAFLLGGVMAVLHHLEKDEADPRLHRVTPSPADRR